MVRDLAHGPRILLRRLRELSAEPLEPQERLDRIVRQIAANMVAEVCSVYVLRADGVLELYATEGLNKESVHTAQLKMGEGLVGTIAASAQPLNLSDAQSHPAFAYLVSGEELFHSFMGVPILRAGRALGVLTVQNRAQRHYSDDEVEALETVSMLLAEMVASGGLKKLTRPGEELDLTRPVMVDGEAYGDGIGLGYVVLHDPRVVVTNLLNDDVDLELNRLGEALGSLRIHIDDMLSRREVSMEGEHRQVLEAYRMFAHDRGWVRKLEEAIRNGLTAEAAVERVQSETRARMMRLTDPYLRERMHDFDDLANRLLRQLAGFGAHTATADKFPNDAIIIARNMGAAELLDYPRANVRGLVLEEGAVTSHIVIVAKAMGIPVVGQAAGVVALAEKGDAVIIDGEDGKVHLRPAQDVQKAYEEKVRFRARRQEQFRALRSVEPLTRDGKRISLNMNAGLLVDLPQLAESGAEGIGLFRTELQFMIASTMPKGEEQEDFYRNVIKQAGNRPVTFRTLDIGSDKVVPYFQAIKEENPALGWRAIRLALDRPGLLRTQLRALLKAAGGTELKIMIPMVTEVEEMRKVRALIQKEVQHLSKFGHQLPRKLQYGAMLEVPSLLWQLDELMMEADFVSVGSNDLFQFAMAVDRGNQRVSDRFDNLGKPFLRLLRDIVRAGERNGTPVTLCGEMAGKPISAMALIGIGFRSVSMSPASIGPVKAMLLGLDAGALSRTLNEVLDDKTSNIPVRDILKRFAESHNIPL